MKFFFTCFCALILFSCSKNEEAKYTFVGEFDYEITNDTLLNHTHLKSDGLGYTIGDLEIQGIEIKNIETIDESQNQFIVSMNSPVLNAYKNSEYIDCNCYSKGYNPLEVIKDTSIIKEKLFIELRKM